MGMLLIEPPTKFARLIKKYILFGKVHEFGFRCSTTLCHPLVLMDDKIRTHVLIK